MQAGVDSHPGRRDLVGHARRAQCRFAAHELIPLMFIDVHFFNAQVGFVVGGVVAACASNDSLETRPAVLSTSDGGATWSVASEIARELRDRRGLVARRSTEKVAAPMKVSIKPVCRECVLGTARVSDPDDGVGSTSRWPSCSWRDDACHETGVVACGADPDVVDLHARKSSSHLHAAENHDRHTEAITFQAALAS